MMSVKRVLNLMGKEASNWKQQKQISVFAKWSKLDLPKVLDPVAVPILEPIEESELKSISNANATFNAKASRLHHFFSQHETDLGILIVHELRFSFRRLGGMLIPSSYTLQQGSRGGVEDESYSWNGAEVGFVLNHGTVGLTSASLTPIVISSNGNILRPLDHGTHDETVSPSICKELGGTARYSCFGALAVGVLSAWRREDSTSSLRRQEEIFLDQVENILSFGIIVSKKK